LFAVKKHVLEELLEDEEWSKKLENAKSTKEVYEVISEYCKVKGKKVKELDGVDA